MSRLRWEVAQILMPQHHYAPAEQGLQALTKGCIGGCGEREADASSDALYFSMGHCD